MGPVYHSGCAEVLEPEEVEVLSQDHIDNHKARMANGSLMVRWAESSRLMLVMEFITEANLYPQLNAFLQKKRR